MPNPDDFRGKEMLAAYGVLVAAHLAYKVGHDYRARVNGVMKLEVKVLSTNHLPSINYLLEPIVELGNLKSDITFMRNRHVIVIIALLDCTS